MEILRVCLLGTMDLSLGGRRLPRFPTRKSELLFSFLALYPERVFSREVLAGIFWGDIPEASARKRLRTELWRVRSVIEPEGVKAGSYLTVLKDAVGLNRAGIWRDFAALEEGVKALVNRPGPELTPAERAALLKAVALYRGDLLEESYEEWCLEPRERLRRLFLLSLEKLMTHEMEHGSLEQAIAHGRRILQHDSLAEHVHRALMRCHFALGDRVAALRQYGGLAKSLKRELGIGPMEETVALYEQIRNGGAGSRASFRVPPSPSLLHPSMPPEKLFAELREAQICLDQAALRLRRILAASKLIPGITPLCLLYSMPFQAALLTTLHI